MQSRKSFALCCFLVCVQLSGVNGVCYLEDANAECEVCWKTVYANPEDKLGVTTATECPDGIKEKWEMPLPEVMVEMLEYPVEFSIKVDNSLFPVREKGDDPHVPHANIHSCIASRGACTPFVSNTPGLSTHTPALKGALDDNGYAKFSTMVRLTEEQYTIIGHIRFYVADADPTKPLMKYDVAIGISRNVQAQTTLCNAGSTYNVTTTECDICPHGTYQHKLDCIPCPPGTHGPVDGLATCLPCTKGYTNRSGMTECEPCPLHTQRIPGTPGIDKTECVCKFGFYDKRGPGEPCDPCPAGGQCDGEHVPPYPRPGFWGDKACALDPTCEGGDEFFSCKPPAFCEGGPDFACKDGHKGRMCAQAEEGYFVVGGQFWVECGKQGELMNILGILGVIVVWMGINSVAAGHYDALDIALLYVQITGMVSSYGMRWHKNVDAVNTVLSIANFDVDFVAPMCIGKWTPVHGFYTQLLLPFIYSCGHVIIHFSKNIPAMLGLSKGPRLSFAKIARDAEATVVNHGMSFCIIVFHTLCLKCFMVFRCQEFPDGNSYMVFAPEVQCWDATHKGMVAVSALYIPLVIIGLPAFMFYIVHTAMRDGTLHDSKLMAKYGFFYARYDTDYKWWECLIMVRRMSIAMVSVIIDTSMLQAAITIVVLLVLLNAHTHTRPFVSDKIDSLEVFTICGSILYALAGMLFYPSITEEAQGELCVGDVEGHACDSEIDLKMIIGVILLFWFGSTLLLAFVVAGMSILDINAQEKARKIVKQVLQIDKFGAQSRTASSEEAAGPTEVESFHLDRVETGQTSATMKRVRSFKSWRAESATGMGQSRVTLEESANQCALHDLLSGRLLLEWAHTIKALPQEEQQTIINEWNYANTIINCLPHDVTHFATSNIANTMRIMTQLPELEDWLCECPYENRQALLRVVEDYSAFLDKHRESKTRYHEAGMVEEEHKPVMLCALMSGTEEQHQVITSILDKILSASDEAHRDRHKFKMGSSFRLKSSESNRDLNKVKDAHGASSFSLKDGKPSSSSSQIIRISADVTALDGSMEQVEEGIHRTRVANVEITDDSSDGSGVGLVPRQRTHPPRADSGIYTDVPDTTAPHDKQS